MIIICRNRERDLRRASRFLLLCMIAAFYTAAVEPRPGKPASAQGKDARLAQPLGEPGYGGSRKET